MAQVLFFSNASQNNVISYKSFFCTPADRKPLEKHEPKQSWTGTSSLILRENEVTKRIIEIGTHYFFFFSGCGYSYRFKRVFIAPTGRRTACELTDGEMSPARSTWPRYISEGQGHERSEWQSTEKTLQMAKHQDANTGEIDSERESRTGFLLYTFFDSSRVLSFSRIEETTCRCCWTLLQTWAFYVVRSLVHESRQSNWWRPSVFITAGIHRCRKHT